MPGFGATSFHTEAYSKRRADEDRLVADIIELAGQLGKDGITVQRSRSTENSRF